EARFGAWISIMRHAAARRESTVPTTEYPSLPWGDSAFPLDRRGGSLRGGQRSIGRASAKSRSPIDSRSGRLGSRTPGPLATGSLNSENPHGSTLSLGRCPLRRRSSLHFCNRADPAAHHALREIGRASCRERV